MRMFPTLCALYAAARSNDKKKRSAGSIARFFDICRVRRERRKSHFSRLNLKLNRRPLRLPARIKPSRRNLRWVSKSMYKKQWNKKPLRFINCSDSEADRKKRNLWRINCDRKISVSMSRYVFAGRPKRWKVFATKLGALIEQIGEKVAKLLNFAGMADREGGGGIKKTYLFNLPESQETFFWIINQYLMGTNADA